MRVLILSQYYSPEPIPKPHELAVALRERGHEVTAITAFPNYPAGRFYPEVRLRLWQEERLDGIRVIRLPLFPDHSPSPLRRCLNYGSFALAAATLGIMRSGPADVLYVESPPLTTGVPAWLLSLLRRTPLLLRVNDLWPESVEATGVVTNQRALSWIRRVEDFVYAKSSAIAVISPGVRRNLVQKGVLEEKVHVIPHWADESIYSPQAADGQFAAEHGLSGRFNVTFAGYLGLAQGLDVVIDAARFLADVPEVQFVFIGDGVEEGRLRGRVRENGLGNVRFLGRQPAPLMPKFFAVSQVLVVHLLDRPLFRITVPSKTMAYMACGRPILMAVEGDAADLIASARAGVVCPSGSPERLAEAVRMLVKMPAAEREALGASGYHHFERYYSREVLLDRYDQLLCQVMEAGRNRSPGR